MRLWFESTAGMVAEFGRTEPQHFGDTGHGRGGAHGHASAGGAGNAVFDLAPVPFRDVACPQFIPVFPNVRAGTEGFALPVSAQHRTRRHEDGGQVHADGAHQQARCGLVAAPHQYATVHRIGAQQFLGLHRQEVAIHHGGRFLEHFGQCDGRHFQGVAARLPHAALDFFGALPEMRMAVVDVAPGVDDGNDRLALVVLVGKPICSVRERCPNERRSCAPYQRWLRNSSGFFFLSMGLPGFSVGVN
jgi:hypothetical protein